MKLERSLRRVAVVVAGAAVAIGTAALPAGAVPATPGKGAVVLDQWHVHGANIDHHWILYASGSSTAGL